MNVLRDAEIEPLVAELSAPRRAYLARVADLLSTGWQARGRRRTILLGAVAHALEFFNLEVFRSRSRAHEHGGGRRFVGGGSLP